MRYILVNLTPSNLKKLEFVAACKFSSVLFVFDENGLGQGVSVDFTTEGTKILLKNTPYSGLKALVSV